MLKTQFTKPDLLFRHPARSPFVFMHFFFLFEPSVLRNSTPTFQENLPFIESSNGKPAVLARAIYVLKPKKVQVDLVGCSLKTRLLNKVFVRFDQSAI